MQTPQTHPHLVALALAAIVMSVTLAALAWLVPAPGQMLARGIRDELDDAPAATIGLQLARLEALREDALPALVDALGSDRLEVSRGARRLIDAEFDRWQGLPSDVGSRHVDHLARLLATHSEGYGAASREQARQLALRIMAWPIDRAAVDRTQLIATCEVVLRIAGRSVPATLAGTTSRSRPSEIDRVAEPEAEAGEERKAEAMGIEPSEQWRARQRHANAANPFSDDPEAAPGLSPEPAILPATRPELGVPRPRVAEDRSQPPDRSQVDDASRPPPLPARVPEDPGLLDGSPLATSRPKSRVASREDPDPLGTEPPALPHRRLPSPRELQEAETIAVVRWLFVDQAEAIAKAELSERGFSEVQIRIARQAVDPDPAVRLQLARKLPNLAGTDPLPWLLWLSRDVDPEVRRTTIGILATSPDPAVQDRLRELEEEETDASVLNVVRRALEQRGRTY